MARKDIPSTQPSGAAKPAAKRVSAPKKRPAPAPATSLPAVAATTTESPVFAAPAAAQKDHAPMEDTVKKTAAQAQTLFADFNDRAKAAFEKNAKLFDEINDFAKGNVEAVVESSKIAAKGFETLGQDAAEYGRKSFEDATAALKQFAAVKSPAEFFKLQSDYVRSAFDAVVAETSKKTEAVLKLAGDVAQPLSNRAAVAAEKIKLNA
ncbi:MAG TPA: TIGR01841 family phasin [Sphingomonas sp.]|nr:TIGR01841 family phasin [Sphingomonas sp.]